MHKCHIFFTWWDALLNMDSCGSYQGVTLKLLPVTITASWDPHTPFLLFKVYQKAVTTEWWQHVWHPWHGVVSVWQLPKSNVSCLAVCDSEVLFCVIRPNVPRKAITVSLHCSCIKCSRFRPDAASVKGTIVDGGNKTHLGLKHKQRENRGRCMQTSVNNRDCSAVQSFKYQAAPTAKS